MSEIVSSSVDQLATLLLQGLSEAKEHRLQNDGTDQSVWSALNNRLTHLLTRDASIADSPKPTVAKDPAFQVVETAKIPMILTDAGNDHGIVCANQAFLDLTGYSEAEVLGQNCRFLQGLETEANALADVRDALEGGEAVSLEILNYRKNGTAFWNALHLSPIFDPAGRPKYFLGCQQDVTEKRNAELTQRKSLALSIVGNVLDHSPVGFAFFDREYRYALVNNLLARMNGLSKADHIGRSVREVIPTLADQVIPVIDGIFERGTLSNAIEIEGMTAALPDDQRNWLDSFFPVYGEDGRVEYVGATVIDITERRRAEEAMRSLNEALELRIEQAMADRKLLLELIDGTDIYIHVADKDFDWLAINRAASKEFARIFGVREPRVGDNMLDILSELPAHREAVRQVWQRALSGEEFVVTEEFGESSLDRRYYEMRFRTLRSPEGEIIGAYQFVYDVTERMIDQSRLREAEAALLQSQKMEAVGQLTGGIAHDFNNLLGAIVGNLDLIRRKPDDGQLVRRFAETGFQAAQRGAKLTGQLLAFSRSQRIELAPIDVTSAMADMRELLARTLGSTVSLHFDMPAQPMTVLSDRTQLELAILNIAINSRDAMPDGGHLAISARSLVITDASDVPTGNYVEISITDTGSGMAADVLAKATEPFFTTKPIGEGTGLGLSQVYGIVHQAGGTLKLESQLDKGTKVRLILPNVEPVTSDNHPVVAGVKIKGPVGTLRVLVVDDDSHMRATLEDYVRALSHNVFSAADGMTGLNMLLEHAPDVIILDFAMPGINGADVASAARKLCPNVPIIFSTGYADTAAIEAALGDGRYILRKPYTIDDLKLALATVQLIEISE